MTNDTLKAILGDKYVEGTTYSMLHYRHDEAEIRKRLASGEWQAVMNDLEGSTPHDKFVVMCKVNTSAGS